MQMEGFKYLYFCMTKQIMSFLQWVAIPILEFCKIKQTRNTLSKLSALAQMLLQNLEALMLYEKNIDSLCLSKYDIKRFQYKIQNYLVPVFALYNL